MSETSHPRLAQILSDIEARCAKYKRQPLDEAQQWADENWSLSESPLAEVVRGGVWYCQLHGMDQTIGFELNMLGARVCGFLDMYLTERLASVELFDAVFALREFASGVRSQIGWRAANDSHDGPRGEAQGNGQVVANNNAPEPDGPCADSRWRNNGQLLKGHMRAGAWRMVNHLWEQPHKTARINELLEPVYGDRSYPISKEAFRSLCRDANRFFNKRNVPLRASTSNGSVTLTTTE